MVKAKFEVINCPLCNSSLNEVVLKAKNIHGSIFLSEDEFTWVRCQDCGLFYLNPRPKEQSIWEYYPPDYYHLGVRIPKGLLCLYRRIYNLSRLKLIKQFVSSGNKLLDLGCGEGEFVRIAQEFGFETFGVEPNIFKKKLKDYKFKNEFFDAVTLWHVLEHLHHPQDELMEIKRVLKKGGRLFLSLPNFGSLGFLLGKKDWYHLDTPRHVVGYDKKTAFKMLQDGGFRVIKINFSPFERPSDLAETINNKIFKQKNYLKILFFLPIFGISIILKAVSLLFNRSETMQIVAVKQ